MDRTNPLYSQLIYENIAQLAYFAGYHKWTLDNGVQEINTIIEWAKEFEAKTDELGIYDYDYFLAIDRFAEMKINGETVDWNKIFA